MLATISRSFRIAMVIFSLGLLLALPARGAAEIVEGVITNVDLHGDPRHISIRQADGHDVDVRVHVSSHINFIDPHDANVSPELSNLRPGMQVRAENNHDLPAGQVDVLRTSGSERLIQRTDSNADPRVAREPVRAPLPGGQKPPVPANPPGRSGATGQLLKVRLLSIGRGEVSADVAGTTRVFRVESLPDLETFQRGDLVIIAVDDPMASRPLIQTMRLAQQTGRVSSIDVRAGRISIVVGGREQTYSLARGSDVRVRVGDQVRFETEERSTGERVITSIERP